MMFGKRHFKAKQVLIAVIGASFSMLAANTAAFADSCWNHNGSTMRLKANGAERWLSYEAPKEILRKAGVKRGTLLFNGRKIGNRYEGTARRFSKFCPGTPLEYSVSGPVRADQLQVTLFGEYEVFSRCQATGRFKNDRLVFTFISEC